MLAGRQSVLRVGSTSQSTYAAPLGVGLLQPGAGALRSCWPGATFNRIAHGDNGRKFQSAMQFQGGGGIEPIGQHLIKS